LFSGDRRESASKTMNMIRRAVPPGAVVTNRPVHASAPWSDSDSAAEYLNGLAGYETTGVIVERRTRRIEAITSGLGSPNQQFPSIHITGTNGKGSTSAMITRLLRSQGLRVGTYTSPHLSDVTERIAIDGRPISEQRFAEALGAVAWMARRAGVSPSWFEAVTAAGFKIFAESRIDVAVVEVGMLGRWDATNIVNSTVTVITNVDIDHTEYAGPGRVDVAMEKAGIAHPGATLVLGETDPELLPIFRAQRPRQLLQLGVDISATGRVSAPGGSMVDLTTPWGEHREILVSLLGAHQCRNAALALAAAESFLDSPIEVSAVRNALGSIQINGRMELLRNGNPAIVFDGAHNRAAGRVLRDAIDEYFPRQSPRVLVCGTSGTRDPAEFLSGIGAADFDLVVATKVESLTSALADSAHEAARNAGAVVTTAANVDDALHSAIRSAGEHGLVVVAGSMYLIAPARAAWDAYVSNENDCETA
jgi:dihydrofolate synthase/folylpolyglutamate synthase